MHTYVDQILSKEEELYALNRKLEAIADFQKSLPGAKWIPPKSYYKKGWMDIVADRLLKAGQIEAIPKIEIVDYKALEKLFRELKVWNPNMKTERPGRLVRRPHYKLVKQE